MTKRPTQKSSEAKADAQVPDTGDEDSTARQHFNAPAASGETTVRIFKAKNEHPTKSRPRGVDKMMVDSIPINHALTNGWSYTKEGAWANQPEKDIKKSDDAVKARERAEAVAANAKQAADAAVAHAKALGAME